MQGMETAYVGNGVSATEASTTVGTEVIKSVAQKYQTNNQIGKTTIEIDGFGSIEDVTGDATVTVYTTDFEVEGTITFKDGILTWGEIKTILPGIKIINIPNSLEKGNFVELALKRKNVSGNAKWISDKTNIATVEENTGKVKGITNGTAVITASVTDNETTYTAQCTITVVAGKADLVNEKIGTVITYAIKATEATATTEATPGYSANYTGTWKIFYANNDEMFIITSDIVPASTVGFNSAGIPISNEAEANGSESIANSSYGYKNNKLWLTLCGQITATGAVDSTVQKNDNKHKATAYLCNSSNWDNFVAKTTGSNSTNLITGSYAVGGPTYELFIDAWNAVKSDTKSKSPKDAYGYKPVLNTSYSISTSDANQVFRINGNGYYWLASPYYSSSTDEMIAMKCGTGCLMKEGYNNKYFGVRPLVSIPMSNVQVDESGNVSILTDAQLQSNN